MIAWPWVALIAVGSYVFGVICAGAVALMVIGAREDKSGGMR